METEQFLFIDVGSNSLPVFADIDSDGDSDLFLGEYDGNINFFRNTGTAANFAFNFVTTSFASADVGNYSAPTFVDIDKDSDLDLFVGRPDGGLDFYRYEKVVNPSAVKIIDASPRGNSVSLSLYLDAQGYENALDFSINFDPAILSNPQAKLGKDASAATLASNLREVGSGHIGIALALPPGQKFAAGIHEIVVVTFTVKANTAIDTTRIEFGDQPTARKMVNANGLVLPTIWTGGKVTIITSVKEAASETPSSYKLGPNYPNPFNPSTTISYDLPQAVEVKLEIFDMLGRHVRTLVNKRQQTGRYAITWDGRNEQGQQVASGTFIYQLRAGNIVQSRRMSLLR